MDETAEALLAFLDVATDSTPARALDAAFWRLAAAIVPFCVAIFAFMALEIWGAPSAFAAWAFLPVMAAWGSVSVGARNRIVANVHREHVDHFYNYLELSLRAGVNPFGEWGRRRCARGFQRRQGTGYVFCDESEAGPDAFCMGPECSSAYLSTVTRIWRDAEAQFLHASVRIESRVRCGADSLWALLTPHAPGSILGCVETVEVVLRIDSPLSMFHYEDERGECIFLCQ